MDKNVQKIVDQVRNHTDEYINKLFDDGYYNHETDKYIFSPDELRRILNLHYSRGFYDMYQFRIAELEEELKKLT